MFWTTYLIIAVTAIVAVLTTTGLLYVHYERRLRADRDAYFISLEAFGLQFSEAEDRAQDLLRSLEETRQGLELLSASYNVLQDKYMELAWEVEDVRAPKSYELTDEDFEKKYGKTKNEHLQDVLFGIGFDLVHTPPPPTLRLVDDEGSS